MSLQQVVKTVFYRINIKACKIKADQLFGILLSIRYFIISD